MIVDRKELSPLHEEITVTVEKADYEKEFKDQLKKYRNEASLKGFRKGKTPISVIRRMFGKSLLSDLVQKKIEEAVNGYIQENKLKTLGQPIPSEDQKTQELDTTDLADFTYKFELGVSPEFEVQGLSKENSFPKYKLQVPDEKIVGEIDNLRKRMGEWEEIEDGKIEENDLIDFEAVELENGEIKSKGWETYFSVSMDRLIDEDLKTELLGKSQKYVVRLDLTNLEKNTDQKFINKYYLNLDEDEEKDIGNLFEAKVAKVRRMKLAEMNEEFFKQAFGDENVDSEEKAKEKIIDSYQDVYGKQADVLLFKKLQEFLLEKNNVDLPEAFLKKWLLESNPEIQEHQLESEFDAFKDNLRWNLIRNRLIEKYEINVEVEEIKAAFIKQIAGYLGGNVDPEMPFVQETVNKMMQNQEQVEKVYQDILFDRLYENMETEISIDFESIDLNEFDKVLEEEQKKGSVRELVNSEEE